jgi:hypothetical protein
MHVESWQPRGATSSRSPSSNATSGPSANRFMCDASTGKDPHAAIATRTALAFAIGG